MKPVGTKKVKEFDFPIASKAKARRDANEEIEAESLVHRECSGPPPELFPGVVWGPGLGVLCWSNRETMESGTGNQWRCRVGPFVCSVQEWPYGLRATIHGHGYKDDCESREDALAWLRHHILAHRDELIRITGDG